MANQDIRVSAEWEHSITNLLGHAPTTEPGIALRQWVLHQGVENHLDLLSWEEEEVKANPTDRIPSTTPGAEPPRDARDSGSARSHSTHLETSSSNRP